MKGDPKIIIDEIGEIFRHRGWHNSIIGMYKNNKIVILKDYFFGGREHKNKHLLVSNWENKQNLHYESWFLKIIEPIIKKYNLKNEYFVFVETINHVL